VFKLRKAIEGEAQKALEIGNIGRKIMQNRSNPQWDTGYPRIDLLIEDIKIGRLYFACDSNNLEVILGMAVFQEEKDAGYEAEDFWVLKGDYISIHRLVALKKGVGRFLINEGLQFAKSKNKIVRIDTHPKNKTMRKLIESFGFASCGSFYQKEYIDGAYAIAYELLP